MPFGEGIGILLPVAGSATAAVVSAPTVRSVIAAELARLTRVTDFPADPLGYGTDLVCTTDLDARMAEVDPLSTRALGEAILRRLDCPRGALPDDAGYGVDVRGMLSRGVTTADIQSLAGRIRGEVTKDDRVDACSVVVTPSPTGSSLAITLSVTPVDPRVGGFRMVLAASSSAVLLEEMSAP